MTVVAGLVDWLGQGPAPWRGRDCRGQWCEGGQERPAPRSQGHSASCGGNGSNRSNGKWFSNSTVFVSVCVCVRACVVCVRACVRV